MLERHGVGAVGPGLGGLGVGFHEQPCHAHGTPARASTGTMSRAPPLTAPRPPGFCTEWVTSNTTGAPVAHLGQAGHVGHEVVVAKAHPRSQARKRSSDRPASFAASAGLVDDVFMSQGARNCPFDVDRFARLGHGADEVVWRHRKAGFAAHRPRWPPGPTCVSSCTSVRMGRCNWRRTSSRIFRPASSPTPRWLVPEERLALSNEPCR